MKYFRSGFTIIELIIVIAIVGLLVMVSATAFTSFNRSQKVEKDTDLVVSVLRQARSQTLASQNATQYGVRLASTTITLFTGTSYSAGAASNVVYLLSTDTSLSASLVGNASDIVFARLTGETTQSGTITLSSLLTSRTKVITVYKTGLVETN